jgi:predicted nuclease of predicted toxin-antitoxin system
VPELLRSAGLCGSERREFPDRGTTPGPTRKVPFGCGHDVVHSSALPDANRTSDQILADQADVDGRVMVTKDRDFEISHALRRHPRRLLLGTTGNITNNALIDLFENNLAVIEQELSAADYVELTSDAVIVHRDVADG